VVAHRLTGTDDLHRRHAFRERRETVVGWNVARITGRAVRNRIGALPAPQLRRPLIIVAQRSSLIARIKRNWKTMD
jgi:transketolase N-terminal domain/subunit